MPRSMRAPSLESRTARLKLPINKKPVWVRIGHGVSLGYRRNRGPGAWTLRVANGTGGHWTKALATADDFDTANGGSILDFWQAQDRARAIGLPARHGDSAGKLATVQQAVEAYAADLRARGGDVANADRIRCHLSEALADKTIATLAARDFAPWRAALSPAKLSPAAINRANTCLRAALNLARQQDERILSARAWETALAAIPDAHEARNVILDERAIRSIIAAAYQHVSPEFGLLVELAAVTGARVSQLSRLEVRDLQIGRADPRLMMPSSRKGRSRKRIDRRPVPIPASLAARLRAGAKDRGAEAPLLVKPDGEPWQKNDHLRPFARAVGYADLAGVTLYALRHSSIVRQLLAGTPIRIVAVLHDTSTAMIEKTYSRNIGDHSDAMARRALLDIAEPAADVVVLPRHDHV
jgi:integrase